MKYRTATIMEEDALNQPTAAGEILSLYANISQFQLNINFYYTKIFCTLSLAADLSLHTLSESLCGSLVVYVIPESSSLLPEVKTVFIHVSQCGPVLKTQIIQKSLFTFTPLLLRMWMCILDNGARLCCVLAPRWKQAGHWSSCWPTWSLGSSRCCSWCLLAALTSPLLWVTECVSAPATKRALLTAWEPLNPAQVGHRFSPAKPHTFPSLLCDSDLVFRLRDNVQPVEPRPKIAPATLGYWRWCEDLHPTVTYKISSSG